MTAFSAVGHGLFNYVSEYGEVAIASLLAVEEAGVPLPIPGDLILLYAGFRASQNLLSFWEAFGLAVLGVTCGSTLLYSLFRFGGQPFVGRFGRYFFLPQERVEKLHKWFMKRGRGAVLIGRFIFALRVPLSAIAGLGGLGYFAFVIQIILASTIWVGMFMGLGYVLGEKWENLAIMIINKGYLIFFVFVGVGILLWLRNKWKKRQLAKS